MDIREAIKKITEREDLSESEMRSVFGQIMEGVATGAQIGAFLAALRMKGETVDEITGAARVMREKAVKIDPGKVVSGGEALLDTCGTGGTHKGTFNISTAAAFVIAGCGVKVAKHGNRAASGSSGSADVLEALGVKIDAPLEVTERCIREIGIGFLFAPLFHSAMKHAAAPRKEIGVCTIFNILGPLSNPASAAYQVIGVYNEELVPKIAGVLAKLGLKRAYVVHGLDKFDEVSISAKTKVGELKNGKVSCYYVAPGDFGIKKADVSLIKGGTAADNAAVVRSVLSGKEGAPLDIVLMNAALGLMAAEKAGSFKEGVKLARESVASGKALEKLEELVRITNGK